MSGTDHTRPVTEGAARPRPVAEGAARPLAGRNRAAKVSGFSALWAVASLGNFATGLAWMNPGVFVGMAVLAALIAVPAGHVGRFRGRRLGGEGRGLALAGILTGWLVLVVCALAALAYLGLVAGLAVLVDHA